MEMMEVADPDAVHTVRTFIRKHLASELKNEFLSKFPATGVAYLALLNDQQCTELALHEYKTATNLTEQFAALAAIAQNPGQTRDDVLADFYSKWWHGYFVVNKWFMLQSTSDCPGNVENVRKLLSHPAFDMPNPNKVASWMVSAFSRWRQYNETRKKLAKAQLEMIMSTNGLSENVFEIASKSLAS
ncbi:hypothetical protein Ancab_032686 [Ancistrocladus abbreviatus]